MRDKTVSRHLTIWGSGMLARFSVDGRGPILGKRSFVRIARFFITAASLAISTGSLTAQTASTQSLQFEVASIKESPTDQVNDGYSFEPGGRIVIRAYKLKYLILLAWR